MKSLNCPIRPILLIVLALASFVSSTVAQEVSIPDPRLNAVIRATLQKPDGPLTQQDLLGLTNLTAISQNISSLQGLGAARNLTSLLLDDNNLTDFSFPDGLSKLGILELSENSLTNLSLPSGMTNLTKLRVEFSGLPQLSLPAGLTKLAELHLGFNQLPSLTVPADMTNLGVLSVYQNHLTNLTLPPRLPNLNWLDLDGNQLSRLELPASLPNLNVLIGSGNQLANFTLPPGLTNLAFVRLNENRLTNLALPPGLTSLSFLQLETNQLTTLILPPDVTQLTSLLLDGNPLHTFALSESLAATKLAQEVVTLRTHGSDVYTYPLTTQLIQPLYLIGVFKFALTGPPGIYTVLSSTNLIDWSTVRVTTNLLGAVNFVGADADPAPQKFYRAQLQVPPANMVYIPPNTFTMGAPANELHRQADEGPLTTVTLSHGFWIGKYEVTQREYLAVLGNNPSGFPGDLDRPVESVSWLDATNYCAQLTLHELAAGNLAPGSHYRLPTEAEWECAARAGTTTRFSYGDDPDYSSLTNHAWYWFNSGFGTHPVGQKAPNPWGLYDMEGNVWEWTLDWYGPYPGGAVTDPQGPASNVQGVRVIRGGAWDAGESDCRSASRQTEGVHPNITDFILGFRVVLVTE
ncbi:MAG TPA: SUMF1/EgtB/PvdO family nonheme iron enzyme [Candidatus Limnocylindria bacterium]|jgi:formylglycine-generating enzyme required for sulfatase activity|nr:SUMF1/EgtB/PvdO family nonheme iron enzyme [Candidatus Limnocylindria bacterium]